MKLTVGSLFSGIGGLDLGFERAGFEIRWQVEIDPYCRRVLAKHWPTVARYEDVREVGGHNLERVDVIVGGFPCQDISIAGKGAGIDGARSGLWREYARLIGELRPRYAVVENVPAIIHRGLERVLADLTEMRYDAEWQHLSAAAFGAPHLRRRVFVIAYPSGTGARLAAYRSSRQGRQPADPLEPAILSQRDRAHRTEGANADSTYALGYSERIRRGQVRHQEQERSSSAARGVGIRRSEWWQTEPAVGRVVDGVPYGVDRIRGLGNAVVPQVAQYVAECVLRHAEN